jgi:hypothetical protein
VKAKNKPLFNIKITFGVFFLLWGTALVAQDIETASEKKQQSFDQHYIQSFYEKLTVRLYLSRKFTNVQLVDLSEEVHLDYEPNSTLNMGVGATYRGFTLNLAYGFGFLNSAFNYTRLSLLEDQTTLKSTDESIQATFGIGNVRFNYAKCFDLSKKWQQRLNKFPF